MIDSAAEILALEQKRCRAEVAADIQTLEDIFDDDIVYIHANGLSEDKTSLIASRRKIKFTKMERRDSNVRVYGNTAILVGILTFDVEVGGRSLSVEGIVTQVFVKRGDRWRIVHHQGTRTDNPT